MGSAGGRAPSVAPPGGRAHGETREAQRLARVVFAVLVVACFVAFVLTQRLKHTPTAVQSFQADEAFRPTSAPAASCRGKVPRARVNASERIEYLSFKPTHAETVTAEIVDSSRTLRRDDRARPAGGKVQTALALLERPAWVRRRAEGWRRQVNIACG